MLIYESVREYFPRVGLPAFDARKAELLLPERRAAYEQELFSELHQWNRLSRRYPTEPGVGRREDRWQQMADEGFELAHIVLQVLQPDGGFVYPLAGPMKRLEELANAGNTGAMCLMTTLVDRAKRRSASAAYWQAANDWLQRGAQRGHPECQMQLGRRLIFGSDGFPRDAKRGLELELDARRAGYAHNADGLASYFQTRWSDSPAELTRLYCWLSIDAESRLTDGPQRMLETLRAAARRTDSAELAGLADELERTKFSLQACVGMGAA